MVKRRTYLRLLAAAPLLGAILVGCGNAPSVAEQEPPTPTPLPPAPALERPTYTVERGPIEDTLTLNGRVTPVDLVRIAFDRQGTLAALNIRRGDVVQQGTVLAELQQDDALDKLRRAENTVKQQQRALDDAKKDRDKNIAKAELALEQARKDLSRVLPGGVDDPIRKAQKDLEQAQRDAKTNSDTASVAKTDLEYQLVKDTEALQKTQDAYSKAYWEWDWVQRYGTDPKEPTKIDPETGKEVPNRLDDEGKKTYENALKDAEVALRDAERTIEKTKRAIDKAREDEVTAIGDADDKVVEAQRQLDELLKGGGNEEVISKQRAVQDAQLALQEAEQANFSDQLTALEDAQADLAKAQKDVDDGRLVAPQNGEILALSVSEGDTVEAFNPIVELADPSNLEIATELGAEQMRRLAEGQPATISLLSRPDVPMPSLIRLMPAPYGSGGSGAIQEQDQTTRFQITDLKGQELTPGAVAKIEIVLERKEDALTLPKDAVRSFEGRRFVVVRQGDRERRVPIKLGIQTDELVEILPDPGAPDGVKAGDIVVGQ